MAELSHVTRVLLVEDEALIALDLEMALRDAGVAHVITALSTVEAFAALDSNDITVGVLDLNLGAAGLSYAVAERMRDARIPFVFSSGSVETIEGFANVPVVTKPFSSEAIVSAIWRVTTLDGENAPPHEAGASDKMQSA